MQEYAVISTKWKATISLNEMVPPPLMMATLVTVGPMSWDVKPREILTSKLFAQNIKIEITGRGKVSARGGIVLLRTLSYLTESSPLFFKTCGVIWARYFPFNQNF